MRPNIVPGVPLINKHWKDNPYNSLAPGGVTFYMNKNAFAIPGAPGAPALGNANRELSNARSPRQFMWDMRFVKGFTVRENYQFNVNATFTDVFNHYVYGGVNQHNMIGTFAPSTTAGPTVAQAWASATDSVNANFGAIGGGSNRVIRVGAEFNF